MALWTVRHATPLIARGVCYGALDVAADAQHTLQAARALAQAIPLHCKVWVSPLQRCMQLADALSGIRPELKLQTDTRLREMDFGTWEGVAWDAIPLPAMQAWTDDFGEHRFGGVESANEVLARVADLWDAARQHPDEPQVWITHAGVARATQLLSQGIRTVVNASQWPKDAPGYGEWWRIDF
jgi:alpha-ribazole phosphatase